VLTLDVASHPLQPDFPQYLVTYIFENPTSVLLHLEVHVESSEECAFAGLKMFHLGLLPFNTYEMKCIILPLKDDLVKLPRLTALDDDRKRLLEVLRSTDNLKVEGLDIFLRIPLSL